MRVLLTGGSGDLGVLLADQLLKLGDTVINIDLAPPHEAVRTRIDFMEGSILSRPLLKTAMQEVDCVVHIAAWHGIHEHNGSKDVYDFHDLNVTGSFNVFEAAAQAGVKKCVLISSTSVDDVYGLYGHTKVLNEEMGRAYAVRHEMDVLVLRPRAFIPPWNTAVYKDFVAWLNWFWKGAVHATDVCQATVKAVDFLKTQHPQNPAPILTIDGGYDYTAQELENWTDKSFENHYGAEMAKLAQRFGLETGRKPKILGSTTAENMIGYRAEYSLKNALDTLKETGKNAPKFPLDINA